MSYLQMQGITKRFGQLLANENVDLAVERGEIHGLMGENGAGKSTLMGVLYGMLKPDAGTISIEGAARTFRGPLDAIAAGVGMVHQSFKLFNKLSVWENLVYHEEPRRGLLLSASEARAQVRRLADEFNMPIDPDTRVGELPIGLRQRLEILKALYRRARILILDEPTAVLTPQERDGLFVALRNFATQGISIVLVTHKLPEIMAITDRLTVLRDGRVVARMVTRDSSEAEIVHAMTGRNVVLRSSAKVTSSGAPVLSVTHLNVRNGQQKLVDDVSFDVRAGEIVGIAGVAGNGQSEMVAAITGAIKSTGEVAIAGHDAAGLSVAQRRAAGLAYVPEDRHQTGTAPGASIADNLAFGVHRTPRFSRFGLLRPAAMREHARASIERFRVKASDALAPVGSLSGGNMQKVVVARELNYGAPLLIAEQPTRGVDIGAIEFIHQTLVAERDNGRGVLIISAELSELLSLSDRILVMYEGRIVAELKGDSATETEIGFWMAGGVSR